MWKCHKCGKPVYFAERKQSLGYDWHPECLRCEECGKRLNPGQHAEHKGVPYCHVPCYGALFGPQLFGHGTRVESHTSFGKKESRSSLPRSHLESKLKIFNQYYEGKSGGIRSREVNGRLILEGALRIYWGVRGVIHLKEDDDQRTVVTARHKNSCRRSYPGDKIEIEKSKNEESKDSSPNNSQIETESNSVSASPDHIKSLTLPMKLNVKKMEWNELDDLLQIKHKGEDGEKLYQTMPKSLPSMSSYSSNLETPFSLSIQSSVDTSEPSSPNTESSNGKIKDNSVNSTPTHSISSSSNTDTPNYNESLNKNGALRRVEYFDSLDKNSASTQSISDEDSWVEKGLNRSMSGPDCLQRHRTDSDIDSVSSLHFRDDDNMTMSTDSGLELDGVVLRRKQGSTAIRRRPGARRQSRNRLKRRCSINGHFYNRETSFFTPPHGSQMSVWVTSLVNTQEVINLMLDKYKVDAKPDNFALFVVRDNGEQRRLREDEYPLEVRVILGPHENITRLFLVDKLSTPEISSDVAQFLNLSLAECQNILQRYHYEEERQIIMLKEKYKEMHRRIKQRMEDLKVRL
ncbi:uncharacterized protein LOC131663222 [Phymastichus coffea]|uniref:uncharacterized protein LOC131663222 n=1 Tax=Phymastichus coffea TaxID=108790 RepID=UPI00273CD4D8|nr:uncharacterized protein LOC131663222 [Phymastichus coffea]